MKKKILALLILIATVLGVMGGVSVYAEVSLEECDKCFQNTVSVLLDRDDLNGNKISATRSPVYDIKLAQLGYVYGFDTAESKGYAIIICDNGNYVAIEMLPDAENPYSDVGENEKSVFVNVMSYCKAVDGKICDIETGEEFSEQVCAVLEENAILYSGGSVDPEYVKVEVDFLGVPDEDMYDVCYRIPQFCGVGLTGACAAVAGGNIIGYFDRYYENLIPNHVAGEFKGEDYYYNSSDTYVTQAIKQLYSDMNGTENGISETNFKVGLQNYCSNKNLNCNFKSIKSNGSINYDMVKSSLKSGQPIALLLSTYNICELNCGEQKDEFYYELYPGNHVMVGFGYREINYILTNGSKSNYKFIYVATGFITQPDAFFNISYRTNINSAYAVNIY